MEKNDSIAYSTLLKTILQMLVAAAVGFFFATIAIIMIYKFLYNDAIVQEGGFRLGSIVQASATLGFTIAMIVFHHRRFISDLKNVRFWSDMTILSTASVAIASLILSIIVFSNPSDVQLSHSNFEYSYLYITISSLIVWPVSEEIIFRNILWNDFANVFKSQYAAVIPSVFWFFSHVPSNYGDAVCLLGLLISTVISRKMSGSPVPGIYIHSLYNAVVLAQIFRYDPLKYLSDYFANVGITI